MGPIDSRAVANKIIEFAERQGKSLTMMQLIKLVYISHGWWLVASDGEPLLKDNVEAWQYGPVSRKVYNAFRKFGSQIIPSGFRATDPETGMQYIEHFTEEQETLIERVVSLYGDFHAYVLSDMMHRAGTPWMITSQNAGHYAPISNELIRSHFNDLQRQRAAS